jgi:6-phosphogluconolactonase (cycloisomerase 2 family)
MTMKVRMLISLLVALVTLSMAACGHYVCHTTFGNGTCTPTGGGPGTGGGGGGISAGSATALAYYVNGSTVAAVGFGGSTLANLSSYTAPSLPGGGTDNMVIVNKKFVYVAMGNTTIQGFSITRSTGALTPIAGSPFSVTSGGGTTDGAWTDPQGRFLFVGSEASGAIWVFQINAQTGALTETAGSPFTSLNLSAADIMTVDASGKFLYVGQLFPSAGIEAFSINQTSGALTEIVGSPFNLGVAQIHASPTGEFLLGVAEIQDGGSSATDQHIYVYSLNATTGVPTAVSGSPFLTSSAPFDFAVSPNGRFVYTLGTVVATKLQGPLEGFQMDTTTGALTSLGAPSGVSAAGCQFEQTGTAMFCVDNLLSTKMFILVASPTTGSLSNGPSMALSSAFPFAVTD